MKIVVQTEWFSETQCQENPFNIYIFGDNLLRIGNGGQAQIRPAKNSVGVATKKTPSMDIDAFFDESFDCLQGMMTDLKTIHSVVINPKYDAYTLIFPIDGLGTGLSELPKRSPFINNQLSLLLKQYFGIITRDDGTLAIIPNKDETNG